MYIYVSLYTRIRRASLCTNLGLTQTAQGTRSTAANHHFCRSLICTSSFLSSPCLQMCVCIYVSMHIWAGKYAHIQTHTSTITVCVVDIFRSSRPHTYARTLRGCAGDICNACRNAYIHTYIHTDRQCQTCTRTFRRCAVDTGHALIGNLIKPCVWWAQALVDVQGPCENTCESKVYCVHPVLEGWASSPTRSMLLLMGKLLFLDWCAKSLLG